MKRIGWLLVAMLALPAAPALAGRDVLRQQSSKVLETAGLRGIRAENRHGDVFATASTDGRIHVTALKLVRSGSRAESEKMSRDIRVEIATEAGELVVRVRYPAQRSIRIGFWDLFNDFEVPSADVQIDLAIPRGIALAVRSTSGDIRTDGVAATQQLDATSGDIRVFDAPGPLRIGTTSGDVEAREIGRARVRTVSGDAEFGELRGPLDAHTTSGDLTIHETADSLLLGTVSGDMVVTDAARGLRATTTSGEIQVRRARGAVDIGASSGSVEVAMAALSRVSITTGSGDIDLRLDRSIGARLELQTSNGSLQMDAPIQVVSLSRRRVEGQLREGNSPVVLRSASGDIHVRTGE
ncbi:MAG: DUF4097 family beta strand repeat-containing protein [Candidatus Eisenbacteria bacterium]